HGVLAAAKPLAGHACPATPLHSSSTSQSSAAARQTVPLGNTTFAGQGWPGTAVQFSFGSHASPEPARQIVDGLATTSGGHPWPGLPVQRSSGSHTSLEPGRQTTLILPGASSGGQVAPGAPVQSSSSSHMSPADPTRQMFPLLPGASS